MNKIEPIEFPNKIKWERLTISKMRSKVPGGWLIRTTEDMSCAICFYPDPEHLWLKDDKSN